MKELTLEEVDRIYPMINIETKPYNPSVLSFRLACAQAKRLYPQHGGGGLLICALVIGQDHETWAEYRKENGVDKVTAEHLVPVMESNPDFLPLPAPVDASPSLNGEKKSSKQSQS